MGRASRDRIRRSQKIRLTLKLRWVTESRVDKVISSVGIRGDFVDDAWNPVGIQSLVYSRDVISDLLKGEPDR